MSDDSSYTRERKLPRGAKWSDDKVYSYRDETGRELFRAHRQLAGNPNNPVRDPNTGKPIKRYFQHWPNSPNGLKPPDARIIPYCLPELITAVRQGRTIFIVEGEPKVEALKQLGLSATCNAEGAGKWQVEHALFLRGAEVVVLPDNDEPGRKHADKIGRSLEGLAKRRQLLELPGLPDKGDIIDWLATGGDKQQLLALVRTAKDWAPYFKAELTFHGDQAWEPPRWLVFERIPQTGV